MSWYRSWFDSSFYHILYQHRDEQEAAQFIDRLIKYLDPPKDARFLDLGCGRGRHALQIHKKGFAVTGVDLSPQNIEAARAYQESGLNFEVHDMRQVYKAGTFHYVLNLFTSFGYFDQANENLKVLRSTSVNLRPKGKVIIDYFNLETTLKSLTPQEKLTFGDTTFELTRYLEGNMICKNIQVYSGSYRYEYQERVAAFTRQDLMGMLKQAGFEILDTFGSYMLEQYDSELSPRLIIVARKEL